MSRFCNRRTVLPLEGKRFLLVVLALAGLAYAALSVSATGASAATSSTAFDLVGVGSPDVQAFARFPERVVDSGDVTGDGVRDVYASSYLIDANGAENAGKVVLVDGATQKVVRELTSPELRAEAPNAVPNGQNGQQFGFYISVPGDVNRDGKDDLVVGAPYQDVGPGCAVPAQPEPNDCNENQGKAYVFSGANGALLRTLENPNPQSDEGVFATFGARIGAAGDVTADSVPDIIIGSPASDVPSECGLATSPPGCRKNEGESFVFNGATGALVRTYRIPELDRQEPACTGSSPLDRCGNLSVSQGPGDVDRDGVPDQLVSAYSLKRPSLSNIDFFGRVYLFSGKTGDLLARIDQPVPDGNAFWGLMDQAPNTPGDVTGDGVPDLYVSGFQQDGPDGEPSAGRGWVFDGAATVAAGKGVVKYSPRDPSPRPSEAFGFTASRTDYNQDGRPDLYLSGLQNQNIETYVFDGRDGSLLKTLALPPSEAQAPQTGNNGSGLGWSSRAPGDLNGDGEPDFVAAAPFQDVNGVQDQGKLYFFLSNVPRQNVPGGGGNPLPPGGGGSIPPKATVCANSKGVKVIGQTNSGGRVFQGTKGNDRICGTSGGDLITGNGGKDVISGGGGNDRINGGSGSDRINGGSGKDLISGSSGDDSISGSSGNDRINGNSGRDRISGGSGNDRLNGSTGSDVVSGSSGKDVISGSSGNDRLSGNSGNDRINGNSGNDRISGGSGNDVLKGGSGNDRIDGGPGKDRISGGSGRNQIKQ